MPKNAANAGAISDGVEILTNAQVRLALDDGRGRASTEAYKTVLTAAGMWDRPGNQAPGVTNNAQLTISNDLAHRIFDIIDKRIT